MSKNVLVCAAHPDDEMLGCGGVIARHIAEDDVVNVIFLTHGRAGAAAAHSATRILRTSVPHFIGYPDQGLDTISLLSLTQSIERWSQPMNPNIVYTHHAGDLNADHRRVTKAVMTAFRPLPGSSIEAIYGYETLSSTEWSVDHAFVPQRYVAIDLTKKMTALWEYDTEMRPYPHSRSYETVTALARFRGSSVGVQHAEAFTVLREVVR